MKEAADGPIAGSEQLPADTVAAGLWMPIITASLLGNVDLQGFLAPRQRAEVRHIPVQAGQP